MSLDNEKANDVVQEGVVDPKETNESLDVQDGDTNIPNDELFDSGDDNWYNNVYDEDIPEDEPADETNNDEPLDSDVDDSESVDEDVATSQKPKQDKETNAAFATLRRKEEELAKREAAIRQMEMERQILSEHLTPEKVWEYAEEHGVSEDIARKLLNMEAQQKANEERIKYQAVLDRTSIQRDSHKDDPLYHEFREDIEALLRDRPDVEFETAYGYVIGSNAKKISEILTKKASIQTEKQTVANFQDKMKRRGIKSSDASNTPNYTSILTNEDLDLCNAFGTNPQSIAKHVKNEIRKRR